MNYKYEQESGRFFLGPNLIDVGYSGKGEGKNNPELENEHNIGPIPVGWYTIDGPFDSPTKGPLMFRLTPDSENEMYGRDSFEIHGDSITHPGEASDGCIILDKNAREQVHESMKEINRLEVV